MFKKLFIFTSLLLISIFLLFLYFSLPVKPRDLSYQPVSVEKGEGVSAIAEKLKEKNLIKNSLFFKIYVKILGQSSKLKAGDYIISPSDSLQKILTILNSGRSLDIKITIIEGLRREEIAEYLSSVFGVQFKTEFLRISTQAEGKLFPDTYLIKKDSSSADVFQLLTNNFENKFAQVEKIKTSKLSKNEIISLASIVEREARINEDRPIIAGILYKRYLNGWPLDADATVQYALGYVPEEKTWWKKTLTQEDLAIESPFNTRKNQNFPPHAISNPGLSSLSASANPTMTDYWFYLSDLNGVTHYAKTTEEHEANIAKYLNQ